jgi:hypothetical protein
MEPYTWPSEDLERGYRDFKRLILMHEPREVRWYENAGVEFSGRRRYFYVPMFSAYAMVWDNNVEALMSFIKKLDETDVFRDPEADEATIKRAIEKILS